MRVLLRCFNSDYAEVAALSAASAQQFAAQNGLQLVEYGYHGPMQKVTSCLSLLRTGVRQIVYTDTDVLFKQGVKMPPEWSLRDEKPVQMSYDNYGLCAGFWIVHNTPETIKMLEVWEALGPVARGSQRPDDQGTIWLLYKNVAWVKKLIGLVSELDVSNPGSVKPGEVAHHFWANGGRGWWEKMRDFDFNKRLRADISRVP